MERLLPYFVLTAMLIMTASAWIVKSVHLQGGYVMCKELEDSFTLMKKHLSCLQIPKKYFDIVDNRFNEEFNICLKDKNIQNGSTSVTVTAKNKNSDVEYRGQRSAQSPSPSLLNLKQQMTTDALYSVEQIDDPVKTLHGACEKGNLSVVKFILSKKLANINSCIPYKGTPVMSAARNGQVHVFKFLVSRGCDLSYIDESRDNVLHIACWKGSLAMVKELIKRKYDVDSRGHNGVTPVLIAARKGVKGIIEFLLFQHCDMKATDNDGNNILHAACIGGHIDMVKYVFWVGFVSQSEINKFGFTPLQMAEHMHFAKVVKFLKATG